MAYLPDANTAWYSRNQMNANWWDSKINCWNLKVPRWSWKDRHLPYPSPQGWVPGLQSLQSRPGCPPSSLLWFGFRLIWPPSQSYPQPHRVPWCLGSGCLGSGCQWWLVAGCSPWALSSSDSGQFAWTWVVGIGAGSKMGLVWSKLPWWSHWCLFCCSGLCGCSSRPTFTLVMVMDPLRWALLLQVWLFWDSCGGCSIISVKCGGVTSIHSDGTMVMKTSSSPKETSSSIACQSSCMLPARWWGWTGTGGCTWLAQYCKAIV